ncbi:hypothetical protein MNEG_2095 [Monoraphidium neglectum]|uniref:Uncharacterized protein n=1 Tax=Monoraphidium neglectum TaxID=145388 RepID=A0A0D2LH76_9CHLO|nr:hypothetical protein MNEG_2095 [Monoraphidium neglectum]KIZ05854.1 hypothetical protein MNEG_2095 [Monoraphidium neglectum]|eukprot:XP_013904873.1 hypothetical protein MNEG_2095 [Monoraphidium neglectum]
MLWLATLPFVLWNHIGWAVVPSTAVVSFLLLGIDEIAIQLEEPFGILPLEAICDTIQRNIEELVKSEAAVVSTLDASIASARARLAQEEELARMLEQQLPFSWGPRGLEAADAGPSAAGAARGDSVAGDAEGERRARRRAVQEAGMRQAGMAEQQQAWQGQEPEQQQGQQRQQRQHEGRAGKCSSVDGGGSGAAYHHHSHHPETHIDPWMQPSHQQQRPQLPHPSRPAAGARDEGRLRPGAPAAGGGAHQPDGARGAGGDRAPPQQGFLEPWELPWYAAGLEEADMLGAAAASGSSHDLHDFLLGRAHGANAVRHPGTPTASQSADEVPAAAAGEGEGGGAPEGGREERERGPGPGASR